MRIKLDEDMPARLAAVLANIGHDVETTFDEELGGEPDPEIWQAAQREARFLITQDWDFSDARRFAPGTHSGLLLIRLRTPNRRALTKRVEDLFRTENVPDGLVVLWWPPIERSAFVGLPRANTRTCRWDCVQLR